MRKALFLDRDGVINIDTGYVHKKEDFIFTDKIFQSLKKYQDLGYLLIIITNQSGINRGYYTLEDFTILTDYMKREFEKHSLHVKGVFYCPHTPKEKCECRKPKPKLILDARDSFDIDLEKSIMIGDKLSDMEAGFNAGVKDLFLIGEQRGDFYINVKSVFDTLKFLES